MRISASGQGAKPACPTKPWRSGEVKSWLSRGETLEPLDDLGVARGKRMRWRQVVEYDLTPAEADGADRPQSGECRGVAEIGCRSQPGEKRRSVTAKPAARQSVADRLPLEVDTDVLQICRPRVNQPSKPLVLDGLCCRVIDLEHPQSRFQVRTPEREGIETGADDHILIHSL